MGERSGLRLPLNRVARARGRERYAMLWFLIVSPNRG